MYSFIYVNDTELIQPAYSRPVHYDAGQYVGPNGNFNGVAVGWRRGGLPFSRTYKWHNGGNPMVFYTTTLPDELTIGIKFQINGETHYGWADIVYNASAVVAGLAGGWEVHRWGYETEPNTPALVVPPPACTGDANSDGDTNAADLSILLSQFGTSVTPGTGADFNSDGVVNAADLSIILSWFGCD